MKKLIRSMMFAAAAAAAFSSCSKDITVDGSDTNTPKVKLRIIASTEGNQTRTEFGDKYTIKWVENDEIGVYIDGTGTPTANGYGLAMRDKNTQMVTFMADVTAGYAAGDRLCAYYPYSADNAGSPNAVALVIPAVQEQAAVKQFNGAYNPLVSVPQTISTIDANELTIKFRQTAAMGEFGIKSASYAGEKIVSLSFTADKNLVGEFNYDLTAITETGDMPTITPSVGAGKTVTVSLPETSTATTASEVGDNLLFFSVIPGTYTGDFVVTTDKATYTLANRTIEFPRAYVKRYTVDLDKAVRQATGPASETIVLNFGDLPKQTSYSTTDIVTTSGWTVFHYMTATAPNTGYIQARYQSSTPNNRSYILTPKVEGTIQSIEIVYRQTTQTVLEKGFIYLSTPEEIDYENSFVKQSVGYEATSDMTQTMENLNTESLAQIKIRPYASSGNVTLYIKSISITYTKDTTPKIVVAASDLTAELASDDLTQHSFSYTTRNAVVSDVTVSQDEVSKTWLTIDSSVAGTVSYTAKEANTGNERTATLSLAIAGGNPVEVTIMQAAPAKPLDAPAGLTATADGTNVTVSWTANDDATGYVWRIATGGADVKSGTSQEAKADISELTPNTNYTVYVKALGDNISFTDSVESSTNVTTGGAPTELVATASTTLVVSGTKTALEAGKPILYYFSNFGAGGQYTNPIRIYQNAVTNIEGANISKITFECNSASYATACEATAKKSTVNAGASVSVSKEDSIVTVSITGTTTSFKMTATAQFRVNAISVTYTE